MRDVSKILTFAALISTLGMVDGAAACLEQPVDVDLHAQRIGLWNLEEKINPALSTFTAASSSIVSINLSDNVLRDEDIHKVLDMIESHGILARMSMLNLSNNRLTFAGVKALIPLLASENLQWLDLSINNLMVDDFTALWKEIDREAYRACPTDDDASYQALRDRWAAKVVLLQKDYHVERFCLAKPFVDAHRRYYFSR
ncbi:hypothetical protein [Candidatus Bodocaedibacter vickermanii]|uniref:Leucine Rich repeats (2 copies) n=1 Tax=Candidatus Bodocaedibacter vickermanii TaxID=2741701 RepID=A0A7L9RSF6_9PROT|nr:hypothetical protein CPBP_00305 [Candidatus Paracaedibacteraceae bacterium 'Lake Konstanz']